MLFVSACDKLANSRSILKDYRFIGDEVWTRFKLGRQGTLKYYTDLVNVYIERGTSPVVDELARVVGELTTLAAERQPHQPIEVPANLTPEPLCDAVRGFVESTSWRFAKTYASTWPHEYVVRTPENAPMLLAIARHIFEHGTDGRFYSQVRKYHHEGGKVYWTMDSTVEATELVNRCDETQTYDARVAAGTLPKG